MAYGSSGNALACSIESIGRIIQQVHRSAAHIQKCRKEVMAAAKADQRGCVESVCSVVLLVLSQTPSLSPDVLKRHYGFLVDLCKAFRDTFGNDVLSIEIMGAAMPFHNALDKVVRLSVVAVFEALLKTVDQSNTTEERQDFYQAVAELLKQRVHDKCPQVREKAVVALSAFQTGKKDCDVTQQLIALLCTDSNADVRKHILHCVAPRKEFLEGYFHGMIRCTRDVVARTRAEAWDALSRFPWRYITAYASAKSIHLPELLLQGFTDGNASVVIACRAALTNCWLHRDCKEDTGALLDPIACGFALASLAPFERICDELLAYSRKRHPEHRFTLDLQDINTSSLLMWKANCKLSCDTEGEDETLLLLPLEQFCKVLQDTVYAYARPDAPPKEVRFRNTEDADNMLRILLSVFEIYEDNAYLAHTDNTTRNSLLRLMNFLLKVVPDDDPALFVDVAIRSVKSLTARTPEEAAKTVTTALDSLFRSLRLPQRYALGFDDVEALGRKSRERQQELVRRRVLCQGGKVTQASCDELQEEMDRDEKFLLRMQLVVLSFLSHSQRGDEIPVFCSHIIQLGRQQDNEKVKVAATRSLGLQCLISPDTVHTFMPLLLADAQEHVHHRSGSSGGVVGRFADVSVSLAAIGVVFDLIMEYGLRFFDTSTPRRSSTLYGAESDLEARLQRERALAEEDVHKVGGPYLLSTLLSYLAPECRDAHHIAIAGFCKLLSCNRVPHEEVPAVLAQLLLHYVSALTTKRSAAPSAYFVEFLNIFLRSYAASHPRRQESFAMAGVAAFRVLLECDPTWATRLMDFVARTADAFSLTQIRDIDPEIASRVNREVHEEDASGATRSAQENISHRANATRSSMQSGRLLRELSRHSLHERIAEALFLELSVQTSSQSRCACLDVLEKGMYFYSKEQQPLLLFCANTALEAVCDDDSVRERLASCVNEVQRRFGSTTHVTMSDPEMQAKVAERLQSRERSLTALLDAGYAHMNAMSSQLGRLPASVKVKDEKSEETSDRKHLADNGFFNIESIVGTRKRNRC